MAQTLQDFLVSIRFNETGGAATLNRVKSLGKGLATVAGLAIGGLLAVKKQEEGVAKSLHSVYLNTKASGAGTVSAFKAISAAAEQVGIDADSMVSSLKGVTSFGRNLGSGATAYLQSLNPAIKATDTAVDKMLKLSDAAQQQKAVYGDNEDALASWLRQVELAGVSEDVAVQMWQGKRDELRQAFTEHLKTQKGIDGAIGSAEKFHNTMTHYQDLMTAQITEKNIPLMEKSNELMSEAVEHIPELADKIVEEATLLSDAVEKITEKLKPVAEWLLKIANSNPELALGTVAAFLFGLPQLLGRVVLAGGGAIASAFSASVVLPIVGILGGLGLMGSAYSDVKERRLAEQRAKGREDPKTWAETWERLKENNAWLKDASDETNASLKESKKRADELRKDAKDNFEETKREIEDASNNSKKWISDLFDTFKTKASDTLGKVGDMIISPANADEKGVVDEDALKGVKVDNLPKKAKFEQKVAEYAPRLMKEFNLSADQAAAVFGNLGHESAGMQAGIQEGGVKKGRGGLGWAQWTGSRRRAFEKFLQENYGGVVSDEASYQFLVKELKGGEAKAIPKLKNAGGNLRAKTINFERGFERSGDIDENGRIVKEGHIQSRVNWAAKALSVINKGGKLDIKDPNARIQAVTNTPAISANPSQLLRKEQDNSNSYSVVNNITVNGATTNAETASVVTEAVNNGQRKIALQHKTGVR